MHGEKTAIRCTYCFFIGYVCNLIQFLVTTIPENKKPYDNLASCLLLSCPGQRLKRKLMLNLAIK